VSQAMKIVDLRSDTVTLPTPAMRAAMAKAEVGDDVMAEDPTVNRLQQVAAERMGKEAGLFVPSGTMGNLAAILTHCGRGDEVIIGDLSHTFLFEAGGVAALGGVMPHTLPNLPDGRLEPAAIKGAVRPDDVHQPISRLVVLENTHNRCGGTVLDAAYFDQVGEIVRSAGLKLHIDGARIFNAAVALGVPAKSLVAQADSVTFCLSKALCAPVGSVLCGSAEFIHKARRIRKQLGGGMRQAGILAAAGLVALDEMIERLADDHRRARDLAEGLGKIPGIRLETKVPASNMVFVALDDAVALTGPQLAARLAESGVKVGSVGPRRFRLVTHYWIDDDGVQQTIAAFQQKL
jgi:threonine aldolase